MDARSAREWSSEAACSPSYMPKQLENNIRSPVRSISWRNVVDGPDGFATQLYWSSLYYESCNVL